MGTGVLSGQNAVDFFHNMNMKNENTSSTNLWSNYQPRVVKEQNIRLTTVTVPVQLGNIAMQATDQHYRERKEYFFKWTI